LGVCVTKNGCLVMGGLVVVAGGLFVVAGGLVVVVRTAGRGMGSWMKGTYI